MKKKSKRYKNLKETYKKKESSKFEQVLKELKNGSGVKFVDDLRDDDLPGGPGDSTHTYLGLMLHNATIIVSSLGGNPSPLSEFDPRLVFQEQSQAIYPQ